MNIAEKTKQNKRYFNRWAKTYDWKPFQYWMKKFQGPILKILQTKKGAVLDVGCGTGELLFELHRRNPALHLHGLDLSLEMLLQAKKKLPTTVTLQEGNVLQLPFNNNQFDYVISTEAFHHYPDQKKAFQEIVRVTKTGGMVMVSDINFFLRPIHFLFEKIEPGCVKINSKREMRILFEQAGLKNITQQRNFFIALITIGVKQEK